MIAGSKNTIHEHFRQCIRNSISSVAEAIVNSPHLQPARYLLMLTLHRIGSSEIAVLLIAIGRELPVISSIETIVSVYLCPDSQGKCKRKHCQKKMSLHPFENIL